MLVLSKSILLNCLLLLKWLILDVPELLQKRFMTPTTGQLALTRFGVHTEWKQNAYISHDRTP